MSYGLPNRASDAGPDPRNSERDWRDIAWEADEMIHSAIQCKDRGTSRAFLEDAIAQIRKALEVL